MTLLSEISKIINLTAIFSLASSFASSLAENQSCKRNINIITQRLSSYLFASSFAKPFAENKSCKESANVIKQRLSTIGFVSSFAITFAEIQTYKESANVKFKVKLDQIKSLQ